MDLETLIGALRTQGIKIKEIYDALGYPRDTFESKRKSKSPLVRQKLTEEIQAAFEGKAPQPGPVQSLSVEERYLQLLEMTNSDLRAEKERLVKENTRLLERIRMLEEKDDS